MHKKSVILVLGSKEDIEHSKGFWGIWRKVRAEDDLELVIGRELINIRFCRGLSNSSRFQRR